MDLKAIYIFVFRLAVCTSSFFFSSSYTYKVYNTYNISLQTTDNRRQQLLRRKSSVLWKFVVVIFSYLFRHFADLFSQFGVCQSKSPPVTLFQLVVRLPQIENVKIIHSTKGEHCTASGHLFSMHHSHMLGFPRYIAQSLE